jgi:lipopolysaccharide biosynthesis glycosyltransferase
MKELLFTANFNKMLLPNSYSSMVAASIRWNCDVVAVNEGLPGGWFLHPAAVKTCIFDLYPDVERVMIVDADIVISESCIDPFHLIDLVEDALHVVPVTPRVGQQNIDIAQDEWYRLNLLMPEEDRIPYGDWQYFNSGVMIANRKFHKEMFDLAYKICKIPNNLCWIDQTPLNWAAKKLGVKMNYLDETWNYVGPQHMHQDGNYEKMNKYIYHFAGSPERLDIIPNVHWKSDL